MKLQIEVQMTWWGLLGTRHCPWMLQRSLGCSGRTGHSWRDPHGACGLVVTLQRVPGQVRIKKWKPIGEERAILSVHSKLLSSSPCSRTWVCMLCAHKGQEAVIIVSLGGQGSQEETVHRARMDSHYPLGPGRPEGMKRRRAVECGQQRGFGGFAQDPGWAPGGSGSIAKVGLSLGLEEEH